MKYTEDRYNHFKNKWIEYQTNSSNNYNYEIQRLFQDIIEDSLNWFVTQLGHVPSGAGNNMKTLLDNGVFSRSINSTLLHFKQVRNELAHPNPPKLSKVEYEYFKNKTAIFINEFKPATIHDDFPRTVVENQDEKKTELKIDLVYDRDQKEYLGTYGRYLINGEEYTSIFGYKKAKNIPASDNGADSLALLKSNIRSHKAIPEIGTFKIVRIFPVKELDLYFSQEVK